MKEITPEIQEWLKNNPQVGTLCRKGEIIFYIIDRKKLNKSGYPTKVEIEPLDSFYAELEPDVFYG